MDYDKRKKYTNSYNSPFYIQHFNIWLFIFLKRSLKSKQNIVKEWKTKFYRLIAIVLLFFIACIPNDYTKKNGLLYKNNKPYTGKYKEFYENGNTKSIFNYLNGKKMATLNYTMKQEN